MKPFCCFIPDQANPKTSRCGKDAEWLIVHGLTTDDYTEACTEHVGPMLTDAPEHKIYPIKY